MGWKQVNLDTIPHLGFTEAQPWDLWKSHMQLWAPDDVPEGGEYFALDSLTLITNGQSTFRVSLVDEGGAPVDNCAVAEGWKTTEPEYRLPADGIPNGGDPRGYPNTGYVFFTGESGPGCVDFAWGPGEYFAPENEEGPHWVWIPKGPSGIYTDVVYGFGMRGGTDHYHVRPKFRRQGGGVEPPEPPAEDELVAAVEHVALATDDVALQINAAGAAIAAALAKGLMQIAGAIKSHP